MRWAPHRTLRLDLAHEAGVFQGRLGFDSTTILAGTGESRGCRTRPDFPRSGSEEDGMSETFGLVSAALDGTVSLLRPAVRECISNKLAKENRWLGIRSCVQCTGAALSPDSDAPTTDSMGFGVNVPVQLSPGREGPADKRGNG